MGRAVAKRSAKGGAKGGRKRRGADPAEEPPAEAAAAEPMEVDAGAGAGEDAGEAPAPPAAKKARRGNVADAAKGKRGRKGKARRDDDGDGDDGGDAAEGAADAVAPMEVDAGDGDDDEKKKGAAAKRSRKAKAAPAKTAFGDVAPDEMFRQRLGACQVGQIAAVEASGYLETVAWPSFDAATSSGEHALVAMLLLNHKLREGALNERDDYAPLVARLAQMYVGGDALLGMPLKIEMVAFFDRVVMASPRIAALDAFVSVALFHGVDAARRDKEFRLQPELRKAWASTAADAPEARLIPALIADMSAVLDAAAPDAATVLLAENVLNLLVDLLAQMRTRRFLLVLVEASQLVIRCQRSVFARSAAGKLFSQLLDILVFYQTFQIDPVTGEELSHNDVEIEHLASVQELQRVAFRDFRDVLQDLALANVGRVESREYLEKELGRLSLDQLRALCGSLGLVAAQSMYHEADEFVQVLVSCFEKKPSQLDVINAAPLYPSEETMWDENLVPAVSARRAPNACLALPRLNLEFLSYKDYLFRNFALYRLESTYAIRDDVVEAIRRLQPRAAPGGAAAFSGWSKFAAPATACRLGAVLPPKIGSAQPAMVKASLQINLSHYAPRLRGEWDGVRRGEVVFLVRIDVGALNPEAADARARFGISAVRGATVTDIDDGQGTPLDAVAKAGGTPAGVDRTWKLALDPAQFELDRARAGDDGDALARFYGSFNVVVRRKPEANNFKSVLDTIRELLNTGCKLPDWFHAAFLGFGNPKAAVPDLSAAPTTLPFGDTFCDLAHVQESFPGFAVKAAAGAQPPFSVEQTGARELVVAALPWNKWSAVPVAPGEARTRGNAVRFTPAQVRAIQSGMSQGLTMIVGPPGTGKTDVAVQIVSNIYHSSPRERILLIAHSNRALNDLFEKIARMDIDDCHLLRLGHGEEGLDLEGRDFSRFGRVDQVLMARLECLERVARLASALGVAQTQMTCESARLFFQSTVEPKWAAFVEETRASEDAAAVLAAYPFSKFFGEEALAGCASADEARERAATGFHFLQWVFRTLEDCRPFELLRTQHDRANYMLLKQARIVAMTTTHASLKRAELAALGFEFQTMVMEEAAQVLEVEAFIPMSFRGSKRVDDASPLKRVVLIGDHHQLPPVVTNSGFQRWAHLDRSLFARLVDMGVPTLDLDRQGRARPSIADIYRWRYPMLTDLPLVREMPEFQRPNAGFGHEFQFVDVGDFQGQGETQPSPHYFQNLGEAEFVVAVFQYMRLIGYPANRISILAMYSGQQDLIRDVVARRCADPRFGKPAAISTVDRYQGNQNDFVLLSLVRTKAFGHVRDLRRLVVAMSRARLGLYVFGRRSLFAGCVDGRPVFDRLFRDESALALCPDERADKPDAARERPAKGARAVATVDEMGQLVAGLI